MAYILTLFAVLGLFAWSTPARTAIADRIRKADIAQDIASSSGNILRAQADKVVHRLRAKAMEMLRKQIHGTVDELVQ